MRDNFIAPNILENYACILHLIDIFQYFLTMIISQQPILWINTISDRVNLIKTIKYWRILNECNAFIKIFNTYISHQDIEHCFLHLLLDLMLRTYTNQLDDD